MRSHLRLNEKQRCVLVVWVDRVGSYFSLNVRTKLSRGL